MQTKCTNGHFHMCIIYSANRMLRMWRINGVCDVVIWERVGWVWANWEYESLLLSNGFKVAHIYIWNGFSSTPYCILYSDTPIHSHSHTHITHSHLINCTHLILSIIKYPCTATKIPLQINRKANTFRKSITNDPYSTFAYTHAHTHTHSELN